MKINYAKLVGYVGGFAATVAGVANQMLGLSPERSAIVGAFVLVGGILIFFVHPYDVDGDGEAG